MQNDIKSKQKLINYPTNQLTNQNGIYRRFIKRPLDMTLSLITIIVISPLLIIISMLIKLDSKGPVFFIQERVGMNNKIFRIYKFRTMVNNAEKMGSRLRTSKNDKRITKVGKYLRKTSLDEIPQLFNILKGDMSVIGPRPTVQKVVDNFTDKEKLRHTVKPGVTGLAQVNGRQSLNWEQKLKYDLQYVKDVSLLGDLKIIMKTFKVVFQQKGVHKNKLSNEYKDI